ncbi:MAG: MFS transporter [Thermoplasmataceae archaeon]
MEAEGVLVSITKAIRSFIFTTLSIVAPFFLSAKGVSVVNISLIILISIAISTGYLYAFTALNLKARTKLFLLSGLFSFSLLILYLLQNPLSLVLAILIGAIPLAGRDLTVNMSIEQYAISAVFSKQSEMNLMFSIYNFGSYTSGALASAFLFLFGSDEYGTIFLIIFIMSLLQFIIYISVRVPDIKKREHKAALSDPVTRSNIRSLALLFLVDSLGGGLVNVSIITLWFKTVYHVSLSQAGFIFILVNVITALSVIVSGFISNRMGLVKTMVYTHLVSNVFLFMVPLFHSLIASEIFLYLRQSTSQMDVPARDSFVNTFIQRDARIASNSAFAAVRNGGQIPGPGVAGLLLETFPMGVFFSASLLKIAYDIAFYLKYRNSNL